MKNSENSSVISRFGRYIRLVVYVATVLALIVAIVTSVILPTPPVVAYDPGSTQPGYTLIAPTKSDNVYLVNNKGKTVHEWKTDHFPGLDTKLLPNGQLLRTYDLDNPDFPMGGRGGGIQLIDWDGTVAWDWQYSDAEHVLHHDATMMPNGDILTSAWAKISKEEAIAAGVNPANIDKKSGVVWGNKILEVNPKTGKIVWQWNAYDHLVQNYDSSKPDYGSPADNPRRIDANYWKYATKPDWLHVNAVDFNPVTNQVIVSAREFNEVWVIDHSTTTAQAATSRGGRYGQGGDLLYRFGNPEAYGHGSESDRTFFLQHDTHWIKDRNLQGFGHVLVFNNGQPGTYHDYSSALELAIPQNADGSYVLQPDGSFAPAKVVWQYAPQAGPREFFSQFMGSVQRLPNGDTLIVDAMAGRATEVKPLQKPDHRADPLHFWKRNQVVWTYQNHHVKPGKDNGRKNTPTLFRAYKYTPDYAGLNRLHQ